MTSEPVSGQVTSWLTLKRVEETGGDEIMETVGRE